MVDDAKISEAVEARTKKDLLKMKRREFREKRRRAEVRCSLIDLFKELLDKGITSECDLGDGEILAYHKDGMVKFKYSAVGMSFPNKIVPTKVEK